MSEAKPGHTNGGLVGTKATFIEKDLSGRDKMVLTLGTPDGGPGAGKCQVTELINALIPFKGIGVKLDIRTGEKDTSRGSKFLSSFIILQYLKDKDGNVLTGANHANGGTTYVPVEENSVAAEQVNRVNESI